VGIQPSRRRLRRRSPVLNVFDVPFVSDTNKSDLVRRRVSRGSVLTRTVPEMSVIHNLLLPTLSSGTETMVAEKTGRVSTRQEPKRLGLAASGIAASSSS
jgi:hypothetical protein